MLGEIGCSTLLYWLLSLVIVFPPEEAVSSGLTIDNCLRSWLGSESLSFVHYHIRRTSVTIIFHCLLLPGYILTLQLAHPWLWKALKHPWILHVILSASTIPLLVAVIYVRKWSKDGWRNHPLTKIIALYTTPERSLATVTSEINNEFIRIDKVSSGQNNVSRIIVTDSWLIKITSYKIYLTALRDAVLILESSEEAAFTQRATSPAQFLTVRVASLKEEIKSFSFRINSSLWGDLQLKLINPVVNTRQIVVHQTLADRFAIVFEETVQKNPKVRMESEQDLCIGCMAVKANVKLDRRCRDLSPAHTPSSEECIPCSCRPMWCLSCLGKWFSARQDPTHTDTWLSSRAPCPTCRSKFCLLDVCIIEM